MRLLALLLIPLLTALLTAVLPSHPRLRRGLSLAGMLLLLGAALALLMAVGQAGRLSVALGDWPLPYAIEFAADGLSAALVLVAALLGLVVLLYQVGTEPSAGEAPGLQPLFQGLLAAVMAVFLAADLFNLYVWFELLLMATLGLLLLGGRPWHAEAAFKYFTLSMLGTLLMLAAIGLIYGATGQLNLGALAVASQAPEIAQGLTLFVVMLLLALLLKAGAFPLFAWLPASYHSLSPPLLALVGGLLTKVALYVLLRLTGQVFNAMPSVVYEALGWLATLTLVTGVLGAAYHWDLRRILAFHIVSQIGYLLLGIALATPAGAAGTAFFLIHNILVKANLFLIAGLIWLSAGHPDLRRIGGFYPARPWLALLFLVNAFSLVGAPPSSGFWGKFLLVQEAFAQQRFLWGGLALGAGLLTLYSMSKIWLEGFWKPRPDRGSHPVSPYPACMAPNQAGSPAHPMAGGSPGPEVTQPSDKRPGGEVGSSPPRYGVSPAPPLPQVSSSATGAGPGWHSHPQRPWPPALAAVTLLTLVVLALGLYPQPAIDWLRQSTASYWTQTSQAYQAARAEVSQPYHFYRAAARQP